jgi:hypothetical protein
VVRLWVLDIGGWTMVNPWFYLFLVILVVGFVAALLCDDWYGTRRVLVGE